jgi:hypothetical protein
MEPVEMNLPRIAVIAIAAVSLAACEEYQAVKRDLGMETAFDKLTDEQLEAIRVRAVGVDTVIPVAEVEPVEVVEPEPQPQPECTSDVFRVSRCVDGKIVEWF